MRASGIQVTPELQYLGLSCEREQSWKGSMHCLDCDHRSLEQLWKQLWDGEGQEEGDVVRIVAE